MIGLNFIGQIQVADHREEPGTRNGKRQQAVLKATEGYSYDTSVCLEDSSEGSNEGEKGKRISKGEEGGGKEKGDTGGSEER
jgi:hypothetical protein